MWGRAADQEADIEVSEQGVEQLGQLGLEVILGLRNPELEGCVLGLGLGVIYASVGEDAEVTRGGRGGDHRP